MYFWDCKSPQLYVSISLQNNRIQVVFDICTEEHGAKKSTDQVVYKLNCHQLQQQKYKWLTILLVAGHQHLILSYYLNEKALKSAGYCS